MTLTFGTATAVIGDTVAASFGYPVTSGPNHSTAPSTFGPGLWSDGTSTVAFTWSDTKDIVGGVIDESWWQPAGAQIIGVDDLPADAIIYEAFMSGIGETTVGMDTVAAPGALMAITDSSFEPLPWSALGPGPVYSGARLDGVEEADLSFGFSDDGAAVTAQLLAGDLWVLAIGEIATTMPSDPTWHYPTYSEGTITQINVRFNWYLETDDLIVVKPYVCRIHPGFHP